MNDVLIFFGAILVVGAVVAAYALVPGVCDLGKTIISLVPGALNVIGSIVGRLFAHRTVNIPNLGL